MLFDESLAAKINSIPLTPSSIVGNVIKGFINATLMGTRDVIADPVSTVKYVLKYNNVARESVELERLQMAVRDNILTSYVKINGMGGDLCLFSLAYYNDS